MNVLFVSNGEAEDAIAISLIRFWLQLREEDRVAGLALAGSGKNYIANDIPLVHPPLQMPSCGFAYQSWKLLMNDFNAGLVSHSVNQIKAIRKLAPQVDYVIGVGDIVPVIAAKIIDKPSSFIGCAMSDYYLEPGKGKVSSYSSIKRRFLKKMNTLVFPRDIYTTKNLVRLGIRAEYHGNPMLDCIEYSRNLNLPISQYAHVVGVLPGSHSDVRENFRSLISIISKLPFPKPITYLVAVADKENIPKFGKDLSKKNFFIQKAEPKHAVWKNNKDEIHLLNGHFGNVLLSCHAVIGVSGTGNEQAVGIGVPTISYPCGSIQYTKRFATAQKRLLGEGLSVIPNSQPSPELVMKYLERAFNDTKYREKVKAIALERFGDFGASERIVHRIIQSITPQINYQMS